MIARHAGDLVLGLDVDGVLAPIVAHADDARLLDGVGDVLLALAARVPVAVVSGRSLENLEAQFHVPPGVELVGSHGLEWRSGSPVVLNRAQQSVLEQVATLADEAVMVAGAGAWRETKPTSVVLHVRQADPHQGHAAAAQLRERVADLGVWVKQGHAVCEVMVVHTSKAAAMQRFQQRHGTSRLAFVGDDLTDEEVFRACGPHDITVRVGAGNTAARYRLADPVAVVAMLRHVVETLG